MTVPCYLREYIQLSRVFINVCIHVHVHTVYVYMYCYIDDGGEVVMNDTAHCTLQAT